MRKFNYLAVLVALSCLSTSCNNASDPSQPNVLILYLDDLGFNDIGAFGSNEVSTPNLDEFSKEGVKFLRHYADSTCSPARAALMSGRFPSRLGFVPTGPGISPGVATIAGELRDLGYSTHHVGKWHMGHITPLAWPTSVGFDSWFGFLSQWLLQVEYRHPHSDEVFKQPDYFDPWLDGSDQEPKQYSGHLTDILSQHTRQLIKDLAKKNQAWFINHWFYLPHTPIQPAPRYAREFDDTGRGRSLAMLAQLDDAIGSILKVLSETGQSDNTIVIIAGDNGGANIHRDNNLPFHGQKAYYTEGGTRTPMMIRWPKKFPKNKAIDEVVSIVDIFPTVIHAAGGKPPSDIDGLNLNDLIVDDLPLPKRSLYWEYHFIGLYAFSVLSEDGRWRLSSVSPEWPYRSSLMLNDLDADPTGKENVISQYPDRAQSLLEEYEKWTKSINRLPLKERQLENHDREISGLDFLRSPGFGPFAFAIGVELPQTAISLDTIELVRQEGVWGITLFGENRNIEVSFGDYKLNGFLTSSSNCQAIIVTGDFRRRLTNWRDDDSRVDIKLYINGAVKDEFTEQGYIEFDTALTNPTIVSRDISNSTDSKLSFGSPIWINAFLNKRNYHNISEIGKEVCR